MKLTLTACPECGQPAETHGRYVLESTHGPVEHVKVRCVTGEHVFNMPTAMLGKAPAQ